MFKNTKISHLKVASNAEVGLGGESRGGRVDRGQPGPGAHQRSGSDNFHLPLIFISLPDVDKLREIIRDMRTGN